MSSDAVNPDTIATRLSEIRARIHAAASAAGRHPDTVRLIAVSKRMPADCVRMAMAAGQFCFGENTVQDALTKQALIDDPRTEWHFIGHLQRNKADAIPGRFAWLHTLDSLRLAERLSGLAEAAGRTVNVLLQVNVAGDPVKFGLPPDGVCDFAEHLLEAGLPGIRLRGLMTIGRQVATPAMRRAEFAALRELARHCGERFGNNCFSELSMGMSSDFELAISEGATMVRVGSSIFGTRESPPGQDRT
jgi:pyridoxal phosphate enzyme (YggS family)